MGAVSADEAKAIIADQFTVREDVRRRRRSMSTQERAEALGWLGDDSVRRQAPARPVPAGEATERVVVLRLSLFVTIQSDRLTAHGSQLRRAAGVVIWADDAIRAQGSCPRCPVVQVPDFGHILDGD